jgi:hypothetical protein
MVFLAGCIRIVEHHEISPIHINMGPARPADKKSFEDFKNLCSDGDSLFWHLPLNEQKQIAEMVFAHTHNLRHVQHIGLTYQKGKPYKIEMLLHDGTFWEIHTLSFEKDWKGKWIWSGTGMILADPWDAFSIPE